MHRSNWQTGPVALLMPLILLALLGTPGAVSADQAEVIDAIEQRLAEARRLAETDTHERALEMLEAIADDERATTIQRFEARVSKAGLLRQLERKAEAAAAYHQAGLIDGVQPGPAADQLLRAGDIYRRLGEYDQAIEAFNDVLPLATGWKRHEDAEGRIREIDALRHGEPGFWINPYVPRVDATSASVVWVARPGVESGELRLEAGDDTRSFTSETRALGTHGMTKGVRHVVEIDGLEPHTRYHYTVQCAGGERTGSFLTTAPPDQTPSMRFLVYGDTQDRPRFHTQTAAVMAEENADFILHTGDLVGRGNRWGHWKVQFFDPARDLFAHAPIWPGIGNHDGSRLFDRLFLREDQLYTRFRHGHAEFFILASYRVGSIGSNQRNAQLDWLEQSLRESDATWKFVVLHHPMFYPGGEIPQQPSNRSGWGQTDFLPLVQNYEVDMVFSGHYHAYQRLQPIADEGKKPVFNITTGGGASVGGDFGHAGEGRPAIDSAILDVGVQALHYCHIEIDGDRLHMRVKLRDGSLIDELELIKRDGRYPEDIEARAVETAYAIRHVSDYHRQRWEAEEAAAAGEHTFTLRQAWRFHFDPRQRGVEVGWHEPGLDTSHWPYTRVGAFWEDTAVGIAYREAHGDNYEGVAWYRTSFELPEDLDPRRIALHFGRIDAAADIYVNGDLVMERPYPYEGDLESYRKPFEVELPIELLHRDRANTLAVRVDNISGQGGIAERVELRLWTDPAQE